MAQFPNETTGSGEFDRQPDEFRDWITLDESSGFPPDKKRYHLYVSLACPWAHRTIITRRLKKLEKIVGMTIVDPIRTDEEGWRFTDRGDPLIKEYGPDPVNNFQFLKEAYRATDPKFAGRVTVPVLWDKT
jgi:putative glutathione S-transferase